MRTTITLRPSRPDCPSVSGTMKGMILSIPGVEDVKVHYEDRSLDITFESDKTSPEAIIKSIGNELGLALEAVKPETNQKSGTGEACPS